MTTSAGMV